MLNQIVFNTRSTNSDIIATFSHSTVAILAWAMG